MCSRRNSVQLKTCLGDKEVILNLEVTHVAKKASTNMILPYHQLKYLMQYEWSIDLQAPAR